MSKKRVKWILIIFTSLDFLFVIFLVGYLQMRIHNLEVEHAEYVQNVNNLLDLAKQDCRSNQELK